MDHHKRSKHHNNYLFRSSRKKYPYGYLEDCSTLATKRTQELPKNKQTPTDVPNDKQIIKDVPMIKETPKEPNNNKEILIDKEASKEVNKNTEVDTRAVGLEKTAERDDGLDDKKVVTFLPVSFILATQQNLFLTNENNYAIQFHTGMLEGNGMTINDTGDKITFDITGSYRFDLCADATPFSDVNLKLVFDCDGFDEEIKPFSETLIPKKENQFCLRGLSTILPINKGKVVSTKLIPDVNETILLMSGARLLIYRVA